jgi:hypothetical protein
MRSFVCNELGSFYREMRNDTAAQEVRQKRRLEASGITIIVVTARNHIVAIKRTSGIL